MRKGTIALLAASLWCLPYPTPCAEPPWARTETVPVLPHAGRSGLAPVNGVKLWYAEFGQGNPVILLHGGLINANYWGLQVRALQRRYRVIVLDNRCHGRSYCANTPLSYDLMALDVIELMDFLHIRKAALVGWSDGANVGLSIAIHHPERLEKLFAFAGNSSPAALKKFKPTAASQAFFAEAKRQYMELSPTPNQFSLMAEKDSLMAASQPRFTTQQLRGVRIPTWIADGDRDQFIKRSDTDYLASEIPGAGEVILPRVSHGAPLQDPETFNSILFRFLDDE